MTNSWTDIKNTDLVVIMGGNAAEAHPCGFKWVTEAKANRGAKLIVVDPRLHALGVGRRLLLRRSARAPTSHSCSALINYCIGNDKVQWDYTKASPTRPIWSRKASAIRTACSPATTRTSATTTVRPGTTRSATDGFIVVDDTLQHPRCVWNLLKQHVSIYTPEMVERICGTPKDKFLKWPQMIAETLGAKTSS